MTKREIIQRAKEFCEENQIKEFPVKIIEICKKHGFKVYEEYLRKDVSGFIVVHDKNFRNYDSKKVIVVNRFDSAARRRFTVAHELAHYVLHKGDKELYAHRDAGDDSKIEREANLFASNILMPEEAVRDYVELIISRVGDIPFSLCAKYIANKFAVSISAAEVRLNQLDIS